MIIHIETIPKENHRYPTVGDYWYDENGILQIRVTDMGDEFMEKMVIVHELIEEALTKKNGVTEDIIMDFDLQYEHEREMGFHKENDEPGFDHESPYLAEHTIATSVEMLMCANAGVNWNEYSDKVNSL